MPDGHGAQDGDLAPSRRCGGRARGLAARRTIRPTSRNDRAAPGGRLPHFKRMARQFTITLVQTTPSCTAALPAMSGPRVERDVIVRTEVGIRRPRMQRAGDVEARSLQFARDDLDHIAAGLDRDLERPRGSGRGLLAQPTGQDGRRRPGSPAWPPPVALCKAPFRWSSPSFG